MSCEALPEELVLKLFSYLEAPSLVCVSGVCWEWNTVSKEPQLWSSLYHSRWPTDQFTIVRGSSWSHLYQNRCTSHVLFPITTSLSHSNNISNHTGWEDFEIIKAIGMSGISVVKLVRHKATGLPMVIKSIKKKHLSYDHTLKHIVVDNEWVVKLYGTFHDNAGNLNLILEYVCGGSLFTLVQKYDTLTIDQSRFYISELVWTMHLLHTQGHLFTFLKPANVIRDSNGHTKVSLSDYSTMTGGYFADHSAKFREVINDKALWAPYDVHEDDYVFTLERTTTWKKIRRKMDNIYPYIAPEVFMHLYHTTNPNKVTSNPVANDIKPGISQKSDWWILGVMLFEFLIGHHPFAASDGTEIYRKILNWKLSLKFPRNSMMTYDAQDLIQQYAVHYHYSRNHADLLVSLVCAEEDRYDIDQIKQHPFFSSVNWNTMKYNKAPLMPMISGAFDCSNFEDFDMDEVYERSQDEVFKHLRTSERLFMSNYFY